MIPVGTGYQFGTGSNIYRDIQQLEIDVDVATAAIAAGAHFVWSQNFFNANAQGPIPPLTPTLTTTGASRTTTSPLSKLIITATLNMRTSGAAADDTVAISMSIDAGLPILLTSTVPVRSDAGDNDNVALEVEVTAPAGHTYHVEMEVTGGAGNTLNIPPGNARITLEEVTA